MAGRVVRSLENLGDTASTARVLNLRAINLKYRRQPEYQAHPLFKNPSLNRAIILKHRLREHERDEFGGFRSLATKILIPIETGDLRMGARYLFIGQRNFNDLLSQVFGIEVGSNDRDAQVLQILDETPTLDPFLLRERLRLNSIDAAACYFDISQADARDIFAFAQVEIQQLVEMSVGGDDDIVQSAPMPAHVGKLARKILFNVNDAELEPLRLTLQLTPQQFQEGMFCWKAFLYYKWRLTEMTPQLGPVLSSIDRLIPKGMLTPEALVELTRARRAIRQTLMESCQRVNETLSTYDRAYQGLTQRNDPGVFRDFLRKAPSMFTELGERLGAIDHVISFWRFRFPQDGKTKITPEELADIFSDFEQSLDIVARRLAA